MKKQNVIHDFLHYNDHAIEQSEQYANNLDNDDEPYEYWELEDYHLLTNWKTTEHEGWKFPATEEAHYWCGNWNSKGCLHSEDHQSHDGKAYVLHYQQSCFRPVCEICWEKWIGRQANASTSKIKRDAKCRSANCTNIFFKMLKSKVRPKKFKIFCHEFAVVHCILCERYDIYIFHTPGTQSPSRTYLSTCSLLFSTSLLPMYVQTSISNLTITRWSTLSLIVLR